MSPRPDSLTSVGLGAFFAPEHHALAEQLATVAAALAEAPPEEPRALVRALGREHGLLARLVPREAATAVELGPAASDVRALVLVREALGYTSALADALFAVQGLGSYPIALAGSAPQRAGLLPDLLAGERVAAFALTEPEAGSDVVSLRTRATKDGAGYRLDGDKTLISNAPIADLMVVFATVDPGAGKRAITAFLVERGAPGLVTEAQALSGDHPIGKLRFDGCRAERLGAEGAGLALALRTLDAFRVTVGAAANGMASRALDEALAHVRARRQFGKPLWELATVQATLADMATERDAARLLVARAAHDKDTRGPAGEAGSAERARASAVAAMAKMFATETAQRIIDRAVQLHGGSGVLAGSVVEALYRDIRPLRIYEGATEVQRLVIARGLP
ncbi:MAG: acyl-CoA dehydrogenase family protein [Myxococcales bacterium]|nr:acyl-CoA dehydrogenase family protein [Myxococcales bacterium]